MGLQSLLRGIAQQQNRPRKADGAEVDAWFLRDGSQAECDWANALALEGRLMLVNFGQGAASVAGQLTIIAGQPVANLDVPSGTAIIPLFASSLWTASAGTGTHQILQYQRNLTGAGASVAATAGPLSTRTDSPIGSNCKAYQAYSGPGTVASSPIELADWFYAFADATGGPPKLWTWQADLQAPIVLVGPASISSYTLATATAPTFKLTLGFIELPASAIS